MTTSYTTNLGLALPVTGELTGTWGDTVNTAITELLDTAVAGTTTLTSDADVTLTTTVGAANQARAAVLLCTGARTADHNIIAPAHSKSYVVINATTGGFSVTIQGVGPTTGITVPADKVALVTWGASDFVLVASTNVVDLTTDVTGVLPIANGGTNASSASAALANLAGAPLASPALTGIPTAPTATPLTNNTQIATTAYADAAVAVEKARAEAAEAAISGSLSGYAPLNSPALTGTPTAPTAAPGTNTTQVATTAFVATSFAPLASPALTGTPTVPTASFGTSTTQAASTAFVATAITNATQNTKYSARTSNTIFTAADAAYEIGYTSGTFSQTFTAAATLGNGWYAWVRNVGTGVITMDPNGSETIGGVATATLNPGDFWLIVCDGANFQLNRLAGMNKQVYTAAGAGTHTVQAGVYRLFAEAWGPGGGAASTVGGTGAGGGGYSSAWVNVTPGQVITATVGAGGIGAASAGTTVFGAISIAGAIASGGDINITGTAGVGIASFAMGGGAVKGAPPRGTNSTINGAQPGGGGATCNSSGDANGGDGMIVVTWV